VAPLLATVALAGSGVATLAQTPLVGGVTDTSAVLVVRTTKPASVVVRYGIGALDSVSSTAMTDSAHDNAVHIALEGLLPETRYTYAVEVAGALDAQQFSFTTFPPLTEERSFTFVAFADQDTPSPAPAWATAAAEQPAFVVQLGDFTHDSGGNRKKPKLKEWWEKNRKSDSTSPAGADFSRWIAGSFPFVHIWDDHDYGLNNGDRTFRYRSFAMQAFRDDFPTYPLTAPEQGFWQSFRYAEAEVFVLDLRSQRDPDKRRDDGTKTMLGAAQKAWLLNALESSTARWKFVVSSSVWNPHSKQVDSWALFQREQQEIVSFVRDRGIRGLIVMSGDIHSSGAIDNSTNSYFPEISVPHTNLDEVNCTGGGVCGSWTEGYTIGRTNGGYAAFYVRPDSVTIQAKSATGTIRHSLTVYP